MKLLLIILLLTGCSTRKCYPSKNSRDWSLIEQRFTGEQWAYTFAGGGDTVKRYGYKKLIVNNCYNLN